MDQTQGNISINPVPTKNQKDPEGMDFSKLNKTSNRQKTINRNAWTFIAPMLVYYILFSVVPIALLFILCWTDWNGVNGNIFTLEGINFVGIEQFRKVFQPEYLKLIWNTALMGIIQLVVGMVLGFLIAQIFVMKIRGMYLFRTIWYLPTVCSMAVISQIFSLFLNPTYGIFNILLEKFGFEAIIWTDSTFWMFFWIIVIGIWKGLGGTCLYFMAGLNGVPVELYEAAAVDGVNKYQKMWYITIPMIKPMTSYVFITSCIGMWGTFETVQLISNGGPNQTTEVIMFLIYNQCFKNFNMGFGAALSVVLLFMVMILTIINFRLTNLRISGRAD